MSTTNSTPAELTGQNTTAATTPAAAASPAARPTGRPTPRDKKEAKRNLIKHLRGTGTGETKLAVIGKLCDECDTAEDLLARAKASPAIPEGTYAKLAAALAPPKNDNAE